MDPIVSFVATKGVSLTSLLDPGQRADMRAYMSLVNNVLGNAELYICWQDEVRPSVCTRVTSSISIQVTMAEVTSPRYGAVHPWPLGHLLTWQRRGQVVTLPH